MKKIIILLTLLSLLAACNEDYLDKKPNKALVIPTSLEDLDAILNNSGVMNSTPCLGVIGTTDFFTTPQGFANYTSAIEKNAYQWKPDIYGNTVLGADWTSPYQQIFYANVVLDALVNIPLTPSNKKEYNVVKGRALFHRGYALYNLSQVYAKQYSEGTLNDNGIPLRLTSDVTVKTPRASIGQTYSQIVQDLTDAATLLPDQVSVKTLPDKAVAQAGLAIVNLNMGKYDEAEAAASRCLSVHSSLTDLNTLNTSATRPFIRFNNEVLFHATTLAYSFMSSNLTYVDTALYADYAANDLRKKAFFRTAGVNRYNFKGSYTGSSILFGGISTNEIYLVRAESRVRTNNISGALEDLNTLLQSRFMTGTYIAVTENDQQHLLALILKEKSKELIMRPVIWSDRRRLNLEAAFQKTLQRKLGAETFSLAPNDSRYVYPIPAQEIQYNEIPQNPR